MRRRLKGQLAAFLELGYLLLVAALVQTVAASVVLILLPLLPGVRTLARQRGKARTLAYFLLLGLGFMLLEMGFLQKLILYLAHPIFSAAAVISSILVFGGLGSRASQMWRAGPRRVGICAAAAVVLLGLLYLAGLDAWLSLTRSAPAAVRFAVACLSIGPLAFAMGHLFPTGLRKVGRTAPALLPWAWAANGCASVLATVATPLLSMRIGFDAVTLVAAACYALVAVLWLTAGAKRVGI
jgi:hypothetical protein